MSTLALTMIVGPGDGRLLERCLESFRARESFDEIVIVATTGDETVHTIGKAWATTFISHPWASERYPHGDFAGARNVALDAAKSDYVMWADADDIATAKEFRKKWEKVREVVDTGNFDLVLMQYKLGEDSTILRERIWRKAAGLRWCHPVHEQLPYWETDGLRTTRIDGEVVIHRPEKVAASGVLRNLAILECEYFTTRSRHSQYYLGRDLIALGNVEEGINILTRYIDTFDGEDMHVFDACMDVVSFYLYGPDGLPKADTLSIAKRYAMIAHAMDTGMAELWVYLGDIALAEDKLEVAERRYLRAMNQKYGSAGLVQRKPYYEAIPAVRLSGVELCRNNLEEALNYTKTAMRTFGAAPELVEQRARIIRQLAASLPPQPEGVPV